ncbi:MAG: KaiC domain-containing protein, partial [Candidatus Hydrothermae bacterium]|nr:KaiC domain-containing protein [Candidatus Hydrothermae bacterium]
MENLIKESIKNLSEVGKKAPKLEGVPSGVEGLDELFFTSRIQDGRAIRVPLGGIPRYAVVNLTGISDTGKSLMVEQFAVRQAARGKRVAFITVETPAAFLSVGLK